MIPSSLRPGVSSGTETQVMGGEHKHMQELPAHFLASLARWLGWLPPCPTRCTRDARAGTRGRYRSWKLQKKKNPEWKEQAGLPMTRPEFSAAKDIFELPLSLVRFGDSSLNFVRISSKNQTSLGGTPYGSFAFLQDHRWMDPRASRCGLRGCTAPPVRRPELCLELEALVCV